MSQGYLYVLSNPAITGLLKIGRTDRPPEVRARELHTTGVPQPFVLEHYVQVADSAMAEKQAHFLLQAKGARMSPDREFFSVSLSEAIEVLDMVAGSGANTPDFSRAQELAKLAAASHLPIGKAVSYEQAEELAERLAALGRRGYPPALRDAANAFETAHPNGAKFKALWREYLQLARAYAMWIPLASSNGRAVRADVGRATAEYIAICDKHCWLIDDDFSFTSEFLVEGDQFQYEGYLAELSRYSLAEPVAIRARDV